MEDPAVEIKTLIHHILHRHNIYKMDMEQLKQVLHLLGEEPAEQPMDIQQKIFKGIVRFNQHYRDHVSLALSNQEFQDVSFEIKSLLHKILHQYYFLNAIKAWEMFVPHFQQPGLHSQPNSSNSHGQLLDDQYEKARLHYQYYGPMSVYHFGQQLPPLPPQAPTQHPPPQFSNFQQPFEHLRPEKRLQNELSRPPRGRPPINRSKGLDLHSSKIKAKQQLMSLISPKKRAGQRQGDSLADPSMRAFPEKMQSEQEEQSQSRQVNLQNCLCKGYLKNAKILKCKCQRLFHPDCHGRGKKCLACNQAENDPFNQVVWQLGTFLIDWDEKDSFEGYLNMLSHSNIFSTMQYGVMVSCAHPQYPGLCWPDDILFKINDQPVFEVPALLEAHHQKQRKDRQMIITPYLAALQSNPLALGRLKFNIDVINSQNSSTLPKRNNRKGTFQLCFFIVKQITPDEIFSRVIDEYSKRQRVGPFDWNFYEVEPDRLSVSALDPYTYELIDCPARGINCKHLQCFDLNTFLTMTYETNYRQWKCPFCGNDVRQLLIDKYQLFLLKDLKSGEGIPKKITFFQDGRIVFDKAEEQEQGNSSKSKD